MAATNKIKTMTLASELRIGNWISSYAFINDGAGKMYESEIRKVQVDADLIKFIDSEKFATYNPIPLTPEILTACGFNKDPDDCLSLNAIFYWLGFIQIAIGYAPLINLQHLKYLHQLQNLYFSFYNTELEYTP